MAKTSTTQPFIFQSQSFTKAQKLEIDAFVRMLDQRLSRIEAGQTSSTGDVFTWTNARVVGDDQGNRWFEVKDSVDGLWRKVNTKNGLFATAKEGEQ